MSVFSSIREWVLNWPHWLRTSLFIVGFIGVWCNFSLNHLISNQPIKFQAAGSIIVAWSVFFLARQRISHEAALSRAEHQSLVSAINRLEKHREINEQRLDDTFNLHLLQIAQISRHINVPNPIGPETNEDILDLAKSVAEIGDGNEFMPTPQEDKDLAIAIEQLQGIRNESGPWITLIWRVELFFLIFGTLQWGYGNHWVVALHEVAQSN